MTALPHEFFTEDLSTSEFRTVISMYHIADKDGVVTASMEELSILTKLGREAMRRAVRRLEEVGILTTTRTKRNLGKFHQNRYQLLVVAPVPEPVDPLRRASGWTTKLVVPEAEEPTERGMVTTPSLPAEAWDQCLPEFASTASYVPSGSTGLIDYQVASSQVSQALETSSLKGRAAGAPIESEGEMNRWNADDEFVGAVGLFEDETTASGKPKPKADRRKSSTRGQRPESEWTANDVAAEFAYQLGRRFPRLPGLVNVAAVRGALLRYRSQFDTTPEVEMEVMRMYFEDDFNLKLAQESPSRAHGKYLAMFKTHLTKAHERLGFDFESRVVIEQDDTTEYVYSADGRKFENTIVGRKMLERHEARTLQTV